MEMIDGVRALELLEKAVTERGEDYIYEQVPVSSLPPSQRLWFSEETSVCVYFDGDLQPSCLVGHAIAKQEGVDPALIAETCNATTPNCLPGVSTKASDIFRAAQLAQDTGETWGQALHAAREMAADLGVQS